MSHLRCPGQDRGRWRASDVAEVTCASCGQLVEFWPDEILRECPGCGRRVSNPKFNMGCLEWCAMAAECLGRMRDAREDAVRPVRVELSERLRGVFGDDSRRIAHAEQVLALAEEIGRAEGADPLVIVPAALLHDIGLAGSPPDPGPPLSETHGALGAPRAAAILGELRFPESVISAVTQIIAHHHERAEMRDVNARVIWDADLIVNLMGVPRQEALGTLCRRVFTGTGRTVGERCLGAVAGEA